jgi:hypothetical protein
MTALPDERPVPSGAAVAQKPPAVMPVAHGGVSIPPKALVGTIDTIGGTTYDWWANGPILRMLVNSRHGGIHAVWMYSSSTTGNDFVDRCMRYNFYNADSGAWNWIDSDYPQSGVNVFAWRTGYGSVDSDTSGAAVMSAHRASGSQSNLIPIVARDAGIGWGIFSYSDSAGLGACQWPPLAVGHNGSIHLFPMTTDYDLMCTHITSGGWSEWQTGFDPNPGFPTQNIAASKSSNKVCATWVTIPYSGYGRDSGYFRESQTGGDNWNSPEMLEFPPASSPSSETLPSFHVSSLFPFYDKDDRLNIVAGVYPHTNDTNYVVPSEIWHFCPDNTPEWNRIHIASCDPGNMLGSVGHDAAYACRPSIGQDNVGNLFVVWEQFDSANVETTTNRLRAGIFASRSTDNGLTWGEALKLTDAGTQSMRFPSVIDLAVEGNLDTMLVIYEVDSVAGFYVSPPGTPEGPATHNPVVVQKVSIDRLPTAPYTAVEQRPVMSLRLDATAEPNPFRGRDGSCLKSSTSPAGRSRGRSTAYYLRADTRQRLRQKALRPASTSRDYQPAEGA